MPWDFESVCVTISIHEAARASTCLYRLRPSLGVFQSTKPQGLRRGGWCYCNPKYIFQSTKPQGLRHLWQVFHNNCLNFNPRSRKGFDWLHPFYWSLHQQFQSTKPQGLRQRLYLFFQQSKHFNPRSRKGFDCICLPFTVRALYFNPRSRKGFD